MSDYQKQIRIISRTKELTEKVDKAVTQIPENKKQPIRRQRVIAPQMGDATKTSTTTSEPPPYEVEGDFPPVVTDPTQPPGSGVSINPSNPSGSPTPTAPPPPGSSWPNPNNNTIQWPFKPINYDPTALPPANSGDATIGGGGGGGIGSGPTRGSAGDQATQTSTSNASMQSQANALVATMQANGASDEEINSALALFWNSAPGTHEVGNVYEGVEGPQPNPGYWSASPGTMTTEADEVGALAAMLTPSFDVLNGLVGLDPDTDTPMWVILNGQEVAITAEESSAGGQNEWDDNETPPYRVSYTAGKYWYMGRLSSGNPYVVGASFESVIAARLAADPSYPYYFSAYTDRLPTIWVKSATYVLGDTNSTLVFTDNINNLSRIDDVAVTNCQAMSYVNPATTPSNSNNFGHVPCSTVTVGNAAVCEVNPEGSREDSWPLVGVGVVKYSSGVFTKSVYDSEAPTVYNAAMSSVKIKSSITGDTYSLEPSLQGGLLLRNITTPGHFLPYNANRTLSFPPQPMSNLPFFKPRKQWYLS